MLREIRGFASAATTNDVVEGAKLLVISRISWWVTPVTVEAFVFNNERRRVGIQMVNGCIRSFADMGILPDKNGDWGRYLTIVDTREVREELARFLRQMGGGIFVESAIDYLWHPPQHDDA